MSSEDNKGETGKTVQRKEESLKWYYVSKSSKEQVGPVSQADLQAALANGTIDASSLVWREGMLEWVSWGSLDEEAKAKDGLNGRNGKEREEINVNNANHTIPLDPSSLGWYYLDPNSGEQVGPLGDLEMKTAVENGTVDASTMVWREGMEIWAPWGSLDEQRRSSTIVAKDAKEQQNLMYTDEMLVMPSNNSLEATGGTRSSKKRLTELGNNAEEKRRKRAREARKKRLRNLEKASIYFKLDPSDKEVAIDDLFAFFSKCGILAVNSEGHKRIKWYTDEEGKPKGDGVVTYAHEAAVDNAILILSGTEVVPGVSVEITHAQFNTESLLENGDNKELAQSLKPQKRSGAGELMKVQMRLGWDEDGEGLIGRGIQVVKIVILKNVFVDTSEEDEDAKYSTIQEDMEEGCEEIGKVENITVFRRNKEGAVAIKFRRPNDALKCVEIMNGRWYDGRKLTAELWDGVTDYRWKESEAEKEARLKKWAEWLGRDENEEDGKQPQ